MINLRNVLVTDICGDSNYQSKNFYNLQFKKEEKTELTH